MRLTLSNQGWGAPDLVIEILSPGTAAIDRGPKLKAYARFGVPECWLVDPEQKTIEVYRGGREGYELLRVYDEQETLTSALLPGFALTVSAIFQS